jgi:uncharacterized membrane protein YbhN (UPF0104 family)
MTRPPLHRRARIWTAAHPTAVTLMGTGIVLAALVVGLWGKRDDFAAALGSASWWILAAAVGLQLIWLVARSEAWHVCIGAAGGRVCRRRIYRAAAVGYLGNVFNANFGLGVRIAALRRSAPADSPKASVLVGAEMPIIVVEIGLAALLSFTLVGPLGVAWWIPLSVLAGFALLATGATRLLRSRREGFWRGLEVMRGLRSRNAIIGLVVFAVSMQVVRNWLVLEGLGVDITVLDSIALLIATAALGILPIGPALGAACAVMILGSNGVAVVAAAGALLTATAAAGALCFAVWALADRMRPAPVARASAA